MRPFRRKPYQGQRPPHHASTFADHDGAEAAIAALLEPRSREIGDWLATEQRRISFTADIGRPAGRVANAFKQVWESTWVHAVLSRDATAPEGWWLLTGYPTPAVPRDERATPLVTPALEHLMGAYFHQDWFEDIGDCDRVLARFVADAPALAPLVPAEVDALLTELADEVDVHVHLLELGCEFRASPEEGGYTGWLRHVAATVP